MWIMDAIASFFINIGNTCYLIYEETSDWIWPFNYLSNSFLWLYYFFNSIAVNSYYFGTWVNELWNIAVTAIQEWEIWTLLADVIQWALDAWIWVSNALENILNIIGDWWSTVVEGVQGWIDIAIEGVNTIIDGIQGFINELQADWNHFWTEIFPDLVGWGALDSWIITWLKTTFPFYDTLCTIIDEIVIFLSNPLDWLLIKLEDWFWGEG